MLWSHLAIHLNILFYSSCRFIFENALKFIIYYCFFRNSWGIDWGMDGYMYIERNKNICELGNIYTFPILED